MTFASDTVRMLFHQLPTQVQVQYAAMEARLAKGQHRMHIDGVMTCDGILEVLIRVTFDSKLDPLTSDRSSTF